jgi:hypothetical protein
MCRFSPAQIKSALLMDYIWHNSFMKSVPMYGLKQDLASIVAEAEAGNDVLIT